MPLLAANRNITGIPKKEIICTESAIWHTTRYGIRFVRCEGGGGVCQRQKARSLKVGE